MTVSKLINENNLEQAESGLWHLPGADVQNVFAYSDGDNEEDYVFSIIDNAEDTSSISAELESHIRDWPSEYHLTSKRANLLRALDLSSLDSVLELGCGCGAISRYLAEQGMNVDAIEGSARRAKIAYSRCRELGNVNIVNSNFNHLRLPENSYDAVFLIGVLEYAKRFCQDAKDDRSAVLEIMSAVQRSLKADGVIITAIENRLGLKYLMGTTEDHYGVPYIGVNGYQDNAGIRTYDHAEWRSILDDAGFNSNTFLTPFPDYKIPTVVLHEEFLQAPEAAAHLRGSVSRDYLRSFSSDFNEYLFWQACNQNRSMLEFTNSYLIIAGRDNNKAKMLAAYDFAHFTGSQRKTEFRTVTRKRRGEMTVRKKPLSAAENIHNEPSRLWQICGDEDYLQGALLADIWLQSLMTWQDQQRLLSLFKLYYKFLKDYASQNPDANDMVDILPFNIIVDEAGAYQSFDREWRLEEKLAPEFILFRALFWFVYGNSREFAPLFVSYGWTSIREYIKGIFEELEINATQKLNDYSDLEDLLQSEISNDKQEGLISSLLDTVPQVRSGDTMFQPRLYWAQPAEVFSEENTLMTTAVLGSMRQSIEFDIPGTLSAGSLLRFDPAERDGYFHLYRLKLVIDSSDGNDGEVLLDLNSAEEIADNFVIKSASLCGRGGSAVFVAHDQDPHIEYSLPVLASGLHLEVEMDWPHSEEYEVVRDGLREMHGEWYEEKIGLQKQVDELKFIQQSHELWYQKKKATEQLIYDLQSDRAELDMIKQSRSYRITQKIAGILKR